MEAVKKKMRTLKGKLDEAEAACKKAEEQLQALNDQAADVEGQVEGSAEEIRALEDELDEVESRNVDLAAKVEAAHKVLDENGHAKKTLENRGRQDSERVEKLEIELAGTTEKNSVASARFEEIQAEIDEYEGKLDEQDERLEKADEKVKTLEAEVIQISNTLRSMEVNDTTTNERNAGKSVEIADLEGKIAAKEESAKVWEAKEEELNKDQDGVDAILAEVREKYEATKNEFDAVVAEISEM